jgi:HEAT repeat protein
VQVPPKQSDPYDDRGFAMDALVRDLIRQLNVSLRNMRFYAAEHPTTTISVQKGYDALRQILDQKGQITVGVVQNTLIVDEAPLEDTDTFIARFTQELNVRNIESLTFYRDVSQEEFRSFLSCLNHDPGLLLAEGGAQKLFETQGISHVVANQVKYGKISDSREEGEGLEEAVIAAFLMGQTPVLDRDQKGFLSLLENDPGKVSELINAGLMGLKEKGEEEMKVAQAANRAVEQVGRLLENQPEESDKHAALMAQIMLSMSPEAQASLYRFRTAEEGYPEDRIDALVLEFKDEEVIRLICNVYQGGLMSPEMLARVANRALPSMDRRERIAPDLGRELMKLGMEKDGWELLRDNILWPTYPLNEKIDRLASRPMLDKRDMDRIKELGPVLGGKENGGNIRKLLKSLFATLEGDDPEIRILVAGYLPEFYTIVEDSGKFKRVDLFFCQNLIACLNREPDERVRQSILISLAGILKREILQDHLNAAARALLTLSNRGYLEQMIHSPDSLASQDVCDHLIAALGAEDEIPRKEAWILLKLFGQAVLESILFALEREENPDMRKRLMAIVRSMGKEVTGEIVSRLADTRWYVVQTALNVLGEIVNDSISPSLLTSSAYHDDIRVRREAIRTLGKLKARGAITILCELLGDKDEEIRVLVLKTLGEVGDKAAVPRILPFVQRKRLKGQKTDTVRQAAIEALGKIGDPQAIPALLDLLKSKGFFRREDESIRRSVVEALSAFRDPELEEALQSVAEKDTDAVVREAARRAILNTSAAERRAVV